MRSVTVSSEPDDEDEVEGVEDELLDALEQLTTTAMITTTITTSAPIRMILNFAGVRAPEAVVLESLGGVGFSDLAESSGVEDSVAGDASGLASILLPHFPQNWASSGKDSPHFGQNIPTPFPSLVQ